MTALDPVFAELRSILLPYVGRLQAKKDDAAELYLETRPVQPNGKPVFFGAVQRRASKVSFHLMPVYDNPALLDDVSAGLKKRMQGKSCFNFASVDRALFDELSALTAAGFASYEDQGLV